MALAEGTRLAAAINRSYFEIGICAAVPALLADDRLASGIE